MYEQYLKPFMKYLHEWNELIMDQPVQGFFEQLKLTTYNNGQDITFLMDCMPYR